MNILEEFPKVYYINLDNRTDRREYMESQFDYWGIKDYHRVSASKYLASDYESWKHLICGDIEIDKKFLPVVANSVTHIEMIKNWLETTNDSYMIMMEDDYDLSLIEYWNFDWEYLIDHLPYDWDCIQLGMESDHYIDFFLHPKDFKTFFGPCMINRHYAEKLVKLHYIEGKYHIKMKTFNERYENLGCFLTVDYFVAGNGKTYCIPLIPCSCKFNSFANNEKHVRIHEHLSREAYFNWWKNKHHKFTLNEFFTYNKNTDSLMRMSFHTSKISNISEISHEYS